MITNQTTTPQLNPDTICMTHHAYVRAQERFDLDKDEALLFFRKYLKMATYLCVTTESGKPQNRSHCYGVPVGEDFVAEINVSLDYEVIISVRKHTRSKFRIPKNIEKDMMRLMHENLNALVAKEKTALDHKDYRIAEANAHIYPLRFNIMNAQTDAEITNLVNQLKRWEKQIKHIENEIPMLQAKIRQQAREITVLL